MTVNRLRKERKYDSSELSYLSKNEQQKMMNYPRYENMAVGIGGTRVCTSDSRRLDAFSLAIWFAMASMPVR